MHYSCILQNKILYPDTPLSFNPIPAGVLENQDMLGGPGAILFESCKKNYMGVIFYFY